MPVTWFDGVELTFEVGMSTATGGYGLWGAGRWGEFIWGPGVAWQDLSVRLRSVATNRKFSRDLASWQAGTLSADVCNRDGHLSPDNASSPYTIGGVSQIRPCRPVRLRATYDGTTYGVLRGSVTDWQEQRSLAAAGQGDAWVTVAAADAWEQLADVDGVETAPAGAGELFGQRLTRILAGIGYRGDVSLETGVTPMQATDLSKAPVAEMNLTADSEGGAVWIDADGVLRAAGRYALLEDPRSNTVQVTFGDQAGEVPYSAVDTSYNGDLVCNHAVYTRVGGAPQQAADSVSRSVYGLRRESRTDLICADDADVLSLARWKVARYAAPEKRVSRIVVKPRNNPTVLFPTVLGMRERDLVRVVSRPPGGYEITRDCHVAGISHTIGIDTWETAIDLWSATPVQQFAASRWGVGRWGEFRWFI